MAKARISTIGNVTGIDISSKMSTNTKEGHKSESEEAPQARTLEEGISAAGKYEGDPLDCPCLKDMKEGMQRSSESIS